MTARLIVLADADNVGVLVHGAAAGTVLGTVTVREDIAPGHKVALRDIAAGEAVLKYAQPMGVATQAITAGDHVHTHNVRSGRATARAS